MSGPADMGNEPLWLIVTPTSEFRSLTSATTKTYFIYFQLDNCKDFNERRKIRAAIRELGRKPPDGRQNGETHGGYSSSRSSYQVS